MRALELVGRRVWPPFFLCTGLVLLWAVIMNVGSPVYERTLLLAFLHVIIVVGLQIFTGNSGVVSFGHIAFVAIGAYSSALLTIPPAIKQSTFLDMPGFLSWILDVELGTIEALLAGAGVATVFGILFAFPIVRLGGIQAGIATLAILVIVFVFNLQTSSITRGASTMIGVPLTTTLELALVCALIAIVVAFLFQQSKRGLRLRASRENERAAKSVGVRVPFERGVAWTLSTFFLGLAGALYGHFIVAFSPETFYFSLTFLTLAMLVVGGLTSVSGAVVGVVFMSGIAETLRRFELSGVGPIGANDVPPGTTQLGLALILLVTLIFRPKGITGGKEIPWPSDWSRPRLGRRPVGTPVAPSIPAADTAQSAETSATD